MFPVFITSLSMLGLIAQAFTVPSQPQMQALSSHDMPLNDRYANTFVNDVFKDNILLTLNYLENKVKNPSDVNWTDVEKQARYEFVLNPNETFAFHDGLLPEYEGKVAKTTNAHFNYQEGFKSDGYLTGDGVCHLASLINWVARDAHLQVVAPTPHDFAVIPDVPKQYGTAIYSMPGQTSTNAEQNLYVTNTLAKPVHFVFDYQHDVLKLTAEEEN